MNYHLVVLVHGVWGNPSHMSYLEHQIQNHTKCSDPNEKIIVYKTGSHSGYLTYDGVDINGKRITDEIVAYTNQLNSESEEASVTKFSLIGYSMGGLVCRYALGILYHDGFFSHIRPVHFVTFCTPHLGIVNPSTLLLSRMFNWIAPHVLAQTGKHFFLKDHTVVGPNQTMPLLQWMADPASKFYKALEMFESRSLYANTINDRRTSWYSTSISNLDPFFSMVNESLSAYKLAYIDGYQPTVIDFSESISFKRVDSVVQRFSFQRFLFKTLTWLEVFGQFILITPVYSLFLLGNAIWQRIKMNRRLNEFYRDGAESLGVLYDLVNEEFDYDHVDRKTPDKPELEHDGKEKDACDSSDESFMETFGEQIQDQTEIFVESIFNAVNSANYYDYHHSVAKNKNKNGPEESKLLNKSLVNLKGKEITTDFKLNLIPLQETIVSTLNTLKWNKYPVIIRNTKSTHAAVIYRHPDPYFDEGKVIVRHFIEQVFKV